MTQNNELVKAVGMTAQLCGTDFTPEAAKMIVEELKKFPLEGVKAALKRCCYEIKGRLTLADIIARIDDGRPQPEEAWAMIPKNENDSVVWTTEIGEAFGACRSLIMDGDLIAARMAFKESYTQIVARSRADNSPIKWKASLGWDASGRAPVLTDAVAKGRLTMRAVENLLGPYEMEQVLLSLPASKQKELRGEVPPNPNLVGLPAVIAKLGKQFPDELKPDPAKVRKQAEMVKQSRVK